MAKAAELLIQLSSPSYKMGSAATAEQTSAASALWHVGFDLQTPDGLQVVGIAENPQPPG